MNTKMLKSLAVACGALLLGDGALATTWSINMDSGEKTVPGTIPAGTDAINKTGSGGYILSSTGPNAFHGEASVVGTLRITGNTLDMGGEPITKTGSGYFQLWNVSVLNPGNIACQQGAISLIGSCDLGEPDTHQLSFGNSTTVELNMMENAIAWPVTCAGAIAFSEANGSSYEKRNTFAGAVTASGNVTARTGGRMTFASDFSMASGTVFYKTGDGVLRFCGKTTMDGVTSWLQKGLLLYGNGADVTACIPSSEYTTDIRRPAIKVENGAKVSYNGTGNGYGTLGYQNYAAF